MITEAGIRTNVNVGIRYLAAWLGGVGAAAIDNLMEDVATAEISRSQIWQWIHHGVTLDDGRTGRRRPGPEHRRRGDGRHDRGGRRAAWRIFARVALRARIRRIPDTSRLRTADRAR